MPKLIDLSHPLTDGQATFAGDPKFSVAVHGTVASVGYNMTRLSMATHQGTHFDAPFHFYGDGKTVDQLPLDRFYGSAALVDLAPGSQLAANAAITLDMLLPHEAKFAPGAIVVYRTGWDRKFGTPECFRDFPSLTREAARWIAGRRIGLLGMDTFSPSADWKDVHLTLLHNDVETLIVEGLANLDRLPERFTFIGFPLNIVGRDGSPIRAAALLDN